MSRTHKGSKGPGHEPWSNLKERQEQQADYLEPQGIPGIGQLAFVRSIYRLHVENLLNWKRSYYAGESEVDDSRYDSWEQSLKKQWPDNPILQMVGYDESKVEECLSMVDRWNGVSALYDYRRSDELELPDSKN